jgi:hypothetical protein
MMELLLLLGVIVFVEWLAFTAGYLYRGYLITTTVQRVLDDLKNKNADLIQRLNSDDVSVVDNAIADAAKDLNITLLKCEETSGQFLFYTKDTDQFVCQGRTLEEACENYHRANKSSIGCVADPTDKTDSYFIVEGKICYKLIDD